jgi:hypothetical protein
MSEIKQAPEGWKHQDIWRRRGTDFMVEVSRHEGLADDYEGPHRWCVYAYIYPKHPHFSAFSGPAIYQDASSQLHFHCGCSFLEYPMYDGKVTCVKVGADYHHLHDERFTYCGTARDAWLVFQDADELFAQLQTRADVAKTTESQP